MKHLREGDTLVIWKLDRLGRSLKDLVELLNTLKSKNVGLVSLNDHVDTTTPTGNLILICLLHLPSLKGIS